MRDPAALFARVPVNRTLGFTTARARVVRQGRTIGVCQVDIEQGGREVAVATFTYLFFERPPRPA